MPNDNLPLAILSECLVRRNLLDLVLYHRSNMPESGRQ